VPKGPASSGAAFTSPGCGRRQIIKFFHGFIPQGLLGCGATLTSIIDNELRTFHKTTCFYYNFASSYKIKTSMILQKHLLT
jgi:hypothetical protein